MDTDSRENLNVKQFCRELDKIRDDVVYRRNLSGNDSSSESDQSENTTDKSSIQNKRKPRDTTKSRMWRVPELPKLTRIGLTSHYNVLDNYTIYGNDREEREQRAMESEGKLLPPLETSARLAEDLPDPQNLQEKKMVIKHNLKTGKRKHFENDRALVPTVYTDFFDCQTRKRSYIRAMYTDDISQKQNRASRRG